ncbi:histone-lysine N-methyltransferase trithorax isoform X2 [Eurosta solidaginis]|uniref:histone-lysine N-methyltransferase trithorax isoform X2 n=1 Tax=Eurosta solidaginis TaxID=178769 RepID=UPI003530D603
MGRSKFPGKPSKSINRKRISVLQLDEDEATTAAATTTTTTETEDNVNATSTTCIGGDKRGGGGNCDDEDDGHKRKGGGRNGGGGGSGAVGGGGGAVGGSGEAGSSEGNTNGGSRNGRNVNGSSGGSGTSGGGSTKSDNQTAARIAAVTAENLQTAAETLNNVSSSNKTKCRSSNRSKNKHNNNAVSATEHGDTNKYNETALDNDNKHNEQNIDNVKDEVQATRYLTAPLAVDNENFDGDCNDTATQKAKQEQPDTDMAAMAQENDGAYEEEDEDMCGEDNNETDEDLGNGNNGCRDVDEGAEDEHVYYDDDDDDDDDDDNASCTSRKSQQSACSAQSSSTASSATTTKTTAFAFNRSKRDGRFKNLNLAKPEVMLPSSAKLRQQQKNQLNCPSPPPRSPTMNDNANIAYSKLTIPTTTSSSSTTTATTNIKRVTNPFAAVDGKLCTADTDDEASSSCIMAVDEVINSRVGVVAHDDEGASDSGDDDDDDDGGAGDGGHCAADNDVAPMKPNIKSNEMPSTTNNNRHKPSESATTTDVRINICDSGNANHIDESHSNKASLISSSATTAAIVSNVLSTSSSSSSSSSSSGGSKQKKTVTFKNILETSDDKSAVKKFYNPDNRIPLVSIMKKECMNRPLLYSRSSECIVRPSRLTEILKNNSNIDKLNSLKFRSNHNTNSTGTASSVANIGSLGSTATTTNQAVTSIFGGARLACSFGAPATFAAEDRKHDIVAFRLSEPTTTPTIVDNNVLRNEINPKQEQNVEGSAIAAETHTDANKPNFAVKLGEEQHTNDDGNKDVDDDNEDVDEEEQQIVVDKHFVLPKRSTRSSRVIKPNKWLLEDGIICKKVAHVKTKQFNASATATTTSTNTIPTNSGSSCAPKKEQQNYFGLVSNEDAGIKSDALGIKISKDNKASFGATPFGTNFSSLKANNFVLRQPRLQFDSSLTERNGTTTTATIITRTTTTPLNNTIPALTISVPKTLTPSTLCLKSPLSSSNVATSVCPFGINNSPNSLLSKCALGTSSSSTCSVCNTPVHSSSQQPLKYGVVACSACRKFISKISKSSSNTTLKSSQLQCKCDGNCIIQPHTKIHIKNFKKVYKERCTSCWLKKCLQTLQLSPGDKLRLTAALPHSILKQVEAKREQNFDEEIDLVVRKEADLPNHSPTGFFGSGGFKWKSALDAVNENLKLNLKSNPLAENNTTFGSSSILRPPILEKPLFLKSPVEAPVVLPQQQDKVTEQPGLVDTGSQRVAKSRRREKQDKEKERTTREREKERQREASNPKTATNGKSKTATTTELSSKALIVNTKIETSEMQTRSAKAMSLSPATSAKSDGTDTNSASSIDSVYIKSPQLSPRLSNNMLSPTTTTNNAVSTTPANSNDTHKRQRIDLKGPRVKHVCRSASIVLGQPLATFAADDDDKEGTLTIAEDVDDEECSAVTEITNAEEIVIEISNDGGPALDDTQATKLTTKELDTTQTPDKINETRHAPELAATLVTTKAEATDTEYITSTTDESTEPPAPKSAKIVGDTALTEKKEDSVIPGNAVEKDSLPLQPSKAVTRNSNASNINLQMHRTTSKSSYATTFGKKSIRQISSDANTAYQQQQILRRKEPQKVKTLISIDFWENYDPAEVCQSGFGLIVTETVAQRALCFLCGSAGLEPLIFCSCCCEPYHQYCVMDEYNLKHSSLDETMFSFMDISTIGHSTAAPTPEQFNQITNRLNWLCPRCTVCYTCNMSSGSKVKCQKCQKNYHSTCLGTSKRLLGADRPLICVNCLKCKSCSTTKVSKFVGNLPMCTPCFKLRKRGNYCPICQRCYDDNDFDLKMMECGNCNHWVHSKCEGLSDEQYNLLSTLPESIEFICKKCARRNEDCKMKAAEWRAAVMEEFKSSLMSVLKLLSKSRQACTLLKLSPRKKVRCACGNSTAQVNSRAQPKNLGFNGETDPLALGSDGESQSSNADVYEFREKSTEKCSCMMKTNSYSGYSISSSQSCNFSLMDIKKKINNNDYVSLAEFNYDMINVIQSVNCDELVIAYNEILSEQFPWFQNETKACTDALEEDMYESCSYSMGNSLDGHEDFIEEEQNRSVIDLPEDIEEVLYSLKPRDDLRTCLFCRKSGEGLYNEESRLLYCGHDCWVHTNCAMWSAEVFEEIDGSLQNVHSAIARGRMIKCTVCGGRGATVGCNVKSCGEHYHYSCARNITCAFLTDKSVYCPEHARHALRNNTTLAIETNFEVARPVYVELDRKRKKLLEPSKVQFHIGSLEVKQLGTVFPRFSDTYEAIIPINFLCSRLYWSFKEPWKVVEYTVRTTIQNSYSTLTALDSGRNFTVDHSNPNVSLVQLGLAQIACWHSSLARGEFVDYDAVELRNSTLTKLLPEYLMNSQNSCSAPDENTEEEPQTNADLLPPEIKEAIFEDLPHELLDGISMLDIFPKFMIYEEMGGGGNSEGKTTEMYLSEQSKDGIGAPSSVTGAGLVSTNATANTSNCSVQVSDDDTANSSLSKQLELSNSCSSSNANISLNHIEDALLACTRANSTQLKRAMTTTELQRTKAEMLKKTWTKFENASTVVAAAAMKKRKLCKGMPEIRMTESVLQSLSQHRTKKDNNNGTMTTISRRQSISSESESTTAQRTKTFTWSAAKRYIEPHTSNEKDESKIKLMQVDGVDDSITEYRIITSDAQFTGTVKCERCNCTYRNYESFQRHIPTCEPLSNSESDSDAASRSSAATTNGLDSTNIDLSKLGQAQRSATLTSNANSLPFLQAFSQAIPLGSLQANINGIPIANMSNGFQSVQGLQNIQSLQNIPGLQNIQLQGLQTPQSLGGGFFISQANPTTSNNDEVQFLNSLQGLTANLSGTYTLAPTTGYGTTTVQAAQQQPQLIAVSTSPDGTQQIIQLPSSSVTTQPVSNQQIIQGLNAFQTLHATNNDKKIMLPITTTKPIKTVATKAAQQANAAAKNKIKASSAAVKPIQSKMNTTTVTVSQPSMQATATATPITVLNTGNNATTQLLNQNLLQQMQAAGLTAATTQQPQLLFQTSNGQQQPIVMQQLNAPNTSMPQNIISFVTTDGNQTPQVQYMTIPTANEFKPQAQTSPFITATAAPAPANQFLQGAFLQTDASGNLVLTTTQTPNGLQMLSATPLNIATATPAPPQPQVIGTLINPQTLQLGGNVIATTSDPQQQQQVIISGGATGLEMIAAANGGAPQVILSTQPMYYGLETIVQNTVMSSQQFVSTAMQGVLSQNASFSATTTQASKIEPIVDLPTGYVVLNNVDGTQSIVQQQPQPTATSQQPSFLNTATVLQQTQPASASEQQSNNDQQQQIFCLQTSDNNNINVSTSVAAATVTPNVETSSFQFQAPTQQAQSTSQRQQQQAQMVEQHQSSNAQTVTAKVPPVAHVKRSNTVKATPVATVTKVQPQQVVNKVIPTTVMQQTQQPLVKSINNNKTQQQHQYQSHNIKHVATTAATTPTATSIIVADAQITLTPVTKSTPPHLAYNINKRASESDMPNISVYATTITATTTTPTVATTTKSIATVSTAATLTTAAARKTNLIRPINKAEVKPKVMRTTVTVPKQQPSTPQVQQQQQMHQPKPQQQQLTQQTSVAQQQQQQTSKMALLKPQPQPAQVCLPQTQVQASQFVSDATISLTPTQTPPEQESATNIPAVQENSPTGNKLLDFQQTDSVIETQDYTENATEPPQETYTDVATDIYRTSIAQEEEEQADTAPSMLNNNITHSYDCSHQEEQPHLPHAQQIEFNSLSLEQVENFPPPTPQAQHEQTNNLLTVTHNSNSNGPLANNNTSSRCLQYSNSAFNINVPTNIVNPLQQTMQYNSNNNSGGNGTSTTTMSSRPTNRVLPMQQRQEHIAATTPPLQVKPPIVMPKLSVLNPMTAKCFDGSNTVNGANKIYYEPEAKKDEQILHILHSPQQQQQQQQQQQHQVLQMHLHEAHQQDQTSMVKTLTADDHYEDEEEDTLKCDLDLIETETTLSTTCQQLQEMVHNNLPRYTGTCLVANEKPKELTPTPENAYALNAHVDALGDTDMCEHDDECMDDMDDEDEDDEDDDEEDEDGFSMKIQTGDGDREMTDNDEPAVKQKICKILDNLTTGECGDSLATAATREATNLGFKNVDYLASGLPNTSSKLNVDAVKYQNGLVQNYVAAVTTEDNAAVAAAASEYISQMAVKMSAQMSNGSLEVIGTNFELQQKLTAKLPQQVSLDTITTQTTTTPPHQCDETTKRNGSQAARTPETFVATRKPTPPPAPPQRDPKKISGPHLLYEIQSEDGFTYKSTSIADIWEKVFEAVQVARRAHGLSPLPEGPLADMAGVQMMGLKTNALKYLIEQLPGVERCTKYTPKYHKRTGSNVFVAATNSSNTTTASNGANASPTRTAGNCDLATALDYNSDQEELQENPFDCVRCEPYHTRSEYDMFSWLASRHRKQPIQVFVQPSDTELIPRRGTGSNLPMAMKYRTLKETYKDYVGVFRSHIHGRGLYCTKDIEAGEMVIEYAGELIRSTLTDKRERNYNSRGIGCYMFKIDDNLVVDATMRGNAARFINHSCEPNCYSKVVDILGHKHIIIFALRRIVQGEELTYDYKFPFEDEKIPCSCGSKRCRKYLN